jgi:hypothetical protein
MIVLLPLLLLLAADEPPGGGYDPSRGPAQIFIAPSGEPFRAYGAGPYPITKWFAQADKNGDGKIDATEFTADFMRFFDVLDVNHDGSIDGVEKERYENTVAPESLGGGGFGYQKSAAQATAEWNSKFDKDVNLPHTDRPVRAGTEVPIGAARYDLLGLPEPVAAMDMEVRGRISRNMATEVAQMRFKQLDTQHVGYLTMDTLPRTPAERGDGGGKGKGKHH